MLRGPILVDVGVRLLDHANPTGFSVRQRHPLEWLPPEIVFDIVLLLLQCLRVFRSRPGRRDTRPRLSTWPESGDLGWIHFRGRVDYAAGVSLRRSKSAGLI